jgi:hypothetical protein
MASIASSKTISEVGTVATEPLAEPYRPRKLPAVPTQSSRGVLYGSVRTLPNYKLGVVPMSSSFKSGNPNMYIPQNGLFATQKIAAGTRIISERPLITLPALGIQGAKLMAAFDELRPYEQQKIWRLNPASPTASPIFTDTAAQLHKKIAQLADIANNLKHKVTQEEQDNLNEYSLKVATTSRMFRIAARWHSAHYSLSNSTTDTLMGGLFIETAQLRHSCIPNCHANYNPNTNIMSVQTTHAISVGEELTVPTITGVYYHTASSRAAELKSRFGFTCTCAACDPSSPQFSLHESLRLQIHTRTLHTEHFLDLIDIVTHESVASEGYFQDATLPEPFDLPKIEDLRNAEDTIRTLIENLKATGCEGPELIRWYNALIDCLYPLIADALDNDDERIRWGHITLRNATECVGIGLTCFGADSDEVIRSRKQVERIERAIADAQVRMELVTANKKKLKAKVKSGKGDMRKKKEWKVVGVTGEDKEVTNKDGSVVKIRTYKPV